MNFIYFINGNLFLRNQLLVENEDGGKKKIRKVQFLENSIID